MQVNEVAGLHHAGTLAVIFKNRKCSMAGGLA